MRSDSNSETTKGVYARVNLVIKVCEALFNKYISYAQDLGIDKFISNIVLWTLSWLPFLFFPTGFFVVYTGSEGLGGLYDLLEITPNIELCSRRFHGQLAFLVLGMKSIS